MKLKTTALCSAVVAALPAFASAHHGVLHTGASAQTVGAALAIAISAGIVVALRGTLRDWLATGLRSLVAARPDSVTVRAHCDGPCGIYDPAAARISAEAVVSMTKKMLDLDVPAASDAAAMRTYLNTYARFSAIKEQQAQQTKDELLILWTDYFKPPHLEQYPDLHDTFWQAAKCCSACKVELSATHAKELMEHVEKIHKIFWASKSRDVAFYTAA